MALKICQFHIFYLFSWSASVCVWLYFGVARLALLTFATFFPTECLDSAAFRQVCASRLADTEPRSGRSQNLVLLLTFASFHSAHLHTIKWFGLALHFSTGD